MNREPDLFHQLVFGILVVYVGECRQKSAPPPVCVFVSVELAPQRWGMKQLFAKIVINVLRGPDSERTGSWAFEGQIRILIGESL